MRSFQTQPYMLGDTEGQSRPAEGALVRVKATAEQTGGAFNLFEVVCPPNYATALRIHYAEDVAIYVLAGALTMFWGSEQTVGGVGAYFYQPRGTPHGFRVASAAPARLLYLTVPAGLDHLVAEQALALPNPAAVRAAARYQIEILGPLPD